MKACFCLFLSTLLLAGTAPAIGAETPLKLAVLIVSQSPPGGVTIQRDDAIQTVPMVKDPTSIIFRTELSKAILTPPGTALRARFTVVGVWQDSSEQLYLQFPPQMSGDLALEIHRNVVNDKREMLDKIEAYGPDLQSTLKRYFDARAYHKLWRFQNRQPDHQVALRSARIWFDASYNLTNRPNSIYAIDQEAVKIMEGYEGRAKSDLSFARRYRMYANKGYIENMIAQIDAQDFQAASQIPTLIASGDLQGAQEINARLSLRLEQLTPEARARVQQHQGVNASVFSGNAKFIESLATGVKIVDRKI